VVQIITFKWSLWGDWATAARKPQFIAA